MSQNTNFNDLVFTVIKNTFNFRGRSTAGEFRTAIVVVLTFYFLVHLFSNFFTDPIPARALVVLAVPLILSSQVRRLHDLGMNGLMVIPAQFVMGYINISVMMAEAGKDTQSPMVLAVVGVLAVIYIMTLAFKSGASSQNQFGLAP